VDRSAPLRQQLAELLELAPEDLPDQARLVEDLGLDSLAMMRVLVWLEQRGAVVGGDRSRPARVGDVLSLAGTAAVGGLSIRIGEGPDAALAGATDLPAVLPAPPDPLAPVLAGHGLRLDPVTPEDTDFLYTLAVAPETSYRWRYRGVPPSFEQFAADLWKQVLVQLVARRNGGERVGHLMAYNPDSTAGNVYLGAVFVPAYAGTGLAAHAVAQFVRYLFHCFPLTKVYLEVPGYNWPQVSSGEGSLFQVEGRLRDHDYYAGRRWDRWICAVYPDHPLVDGRR